MRRAVRTAELSDSTIPALTNPPYPAILSSIEFDFRGAQASFVCKDTWKYTKYEQSQRYVRQDLREQVSGGLFINSRP
jgi:hypothetical protein